MVDRGFDPARLTRLERFLRERYIEPGRLPHAQLIVARDGKVAQSLSIGRAREDGAALTDDAIFRIASMTKPVVSLAYMMLVEEGLSALEDPVAKVAPELGGVGVYAGGGRDWPFAPPKPCAPIRMIDLLRHTSGLTSSFQNRTNVDLAYRRNKIDDYRAIKGGDDFLRALGAIPLEFEPGSAWNYSVSTDVLGVIVARLTGRGLGEALRTRIFEPLGMVDTDFYVRDENLHRLTDAWTRDTDGRLKLIERAADDHFARRPAFEGGGGGLVSTSRDYHRFCTMLLNGGELDGVRIVSPKTVQLMMCNHLPGGRDLTEMSKSLFSELSNRGTGFGLGFAVTLDPAATLVPGTQGACHWGGIYSTSFFVDPRERLSMVFMTQFYPSGLDPLRRELKTLIYAALT